MLKQQNETLENEELFKSILEIFASCIHDAAQEDDIDLFTSVIDTLSTLQNQRGLFEKQVFFTHLSDFINLLLKAWQSGVAERIKDDIASLIYQNNFNRIYSLTKNFHNFEKNLL